MSNLKNLMTKKREIKKEKREILISHTPISISRVHNFFIRSFRELERLQNGFNSGNISKQLSQRTSSYIINVTKLEDQFKETNFILHFRITRMDKDQINLIVKSELDEESLIIEIECFEESFSNYQPKSPEESFLNEIMIFIDNLINSKGNTNLLLGNTLNSDLNLIKRTGPIPSERYKLE